MGHSLLVWSLEKSPFTGFISTNGRSLKPDDCGVNLAEIRAYATKFVPFFLADDLGEHICNTQFSL